MKVAMKQQGKIKEHENIWKCSRIRFAGVEQLDSLKAA